MSFSLQAIDVDFTWKNPDWHEDQVKQYRQTMGFKMRFESTKGSNAVRGEDIVKSSPLGTSADI